jgi:GntR family galactonate operon transcriptional repressor
MMIAMSLPTRHQDAVDRIASWIVGDRFAIGTALPTEEEIGSELRVSRTVVREAMRTLAAKGMVQVRRRHGTTVRPVDSWSLFDPQVVNWRMTSGLTRGFIEDLIRFRLGIEPYAAGLAAENADFPAARLNDAYRRMEEAVDGGGRYHEADLDFHETIILGADNQFLRQLIPLMSNTLRASFSLSVINMETARASLPMHRAVADAIITGNVAGARDALTHLIEAAREDILAVLPGMLREERPHGEGNRMAHTAD